jgi:hypothetical protein
MLLAVESEGADDEAEDIVISVVEQTAGATVGHTLHCALTFTATEMAVREQH